MPPELEKRLRALCAHIVSAEQPEFEKLLAELKLLLQEHTLKLENLIAQQTLLLGLGKVTTLEESKEVSRSQRKKPTQTGTRPSRD